MQTQSQPQTQTRVDNTLENLTEEQHAFIFEMARSARLDDIIMALREHGIHVSVPTLSRFLKRHREKRLLEDVVESKETIKALAQNSRDSSLREGTLEAVRQRIYERALSSENPEEAHQLYRAMIAEEAKLKQLDLEAKKIAIAQKQLLLQRMRIENDTRKRIKGTVTDSESIVDVPAAPAQLPSPSSERLTQLFSEAMEILNRGGDVGDRILEARARLAEGLKLLSTTPTSA